MFLGGWGLMTVVAMVPATLPTVRLVGVTRGYGAATLFLAGYVATWIAIGVLGYIVLSPLSGAVAWLGTAALLAGAAAYELSPLKDACLRRCRSPVRVLMQPTLRASFQHGLECAGCCVVLMGLIVALGLMSIWWMLAFGAALIVQKVLPFGDRSPRLVAGGLLVGAVSVWI